MARALQMNAREQRSIGKLYEATGIEHRYSVIEDYAMGNGGFHFFPNSTDFEPFPTVGARMGLFKKHALQLSLRAVEDCFAQRPEVTAKDITHLVTVSCTGMYAPGLDIELVYNLGLRHTVERTAINYMGCYAAFNGLKVADMICRSVPGANVLLVCTELCSLHFQKSRDRDHLLSNALFSDGAAAVLLQQGTAPGTNLSINTTYCDLFPNGEHDMAWKIADYGFEMTLSSYVPEVIRSGIKELTLKLLSRLELDLSEIDYFAIHPGGKKILEVCEEELQMDRHDNRFAYEVLRQYGNMSSPTVLFVLKEIRKGLGVKDHGRHVLSVAFGPGLTLESMVLQVKIC